MAGAQIKNMTMSDARRALIRALDGKLAEMTAQNLETENQAKAQAAPRACRKGMVIANEGCTFCRT